MSFPHEQCPNCKMGLSRLQDVVEEGSLTFCPKCQFPLVLITNKYRLEQVLRQGGCGIVYLASHIHLDRDAERVIKIIRPEIFTIQGMERRFRREVQITSALSQRNEHIVRIYDDFGEIPNVGHFYVMEFLQGEPWSTLLRDNKELPSIPLCMHLFLQLCDTMQFAHETGVVHRDLKPDNLMLIQRKHDPYFLKILDFGIAKPLNKDELAVTHVTQGSLGTPSYMSPEQCLNQTTDARTDIYSMGVILFELLTGRTPFTPPKEARSDFTSFVGVIEAHITKEPPSLVEVCPERASPHLEKIIHRALAKKPQDRFQTVDEMRQALEDFISFLPASDKEIIVNLGSQADDPLSRRARRHQAPLSSSEDFPLESTQRTLFLGSSSEVAIEDLFAEQADNVGTADWNAFDERQGDDTPQDIDAVPTPEPSKSPASRPVMVLADASQHGTVDLSEFDQVPDPLLRRAALKAPTGGTIELSGEDELDEFPEVASAGSTDDFPQRTFVLPERPASEVLVRRDADAEILSLKNATSRPEFSISSMMEPAEKTLSLPNTSSTVVAISDDKNEPAEASRPKNNGALDTLEQRSAESLLADGAALTLSGEVSYTNSDLESVPLTEGGEAEIFITAVVDERDYEEPVLLLSKQKNSGAKQIESVRDEPNTSPARASVQKEKSEDETFGGVVDRIQGPRFGAINLFLVQPQDWAEEPTMALQIQQRIAKAKRLLKEPRFVERYPDSQGKIILEASFFPPSGIIVYLEKEGVELRLKPQSVSPETKPRQARPSSRGATKKRKSPNPRPQIASSSASANTARQAETPTRNGHNTIPSSGHRPTTPSKAPEPKVSQKSKKTVAKGTGGAGLSTRSHNPPSEPRLPRVNQRHTDVGAAPVAPSLSAWEEAEPGLNLSGGNFNMIGLGWGIVALAFLGALFAMVQMLRPDPAPTLPSVVAPQTVSANHLPKTSYATISLKPDRITFVLIPVRSIRSGMAENYVLFASKENRKLLVFAPERESKILKTIVQRTDPDNPNIQVSLPVWFKDVRTLETTPKTRTYTGVLERLQRRPGGPLELVLPDENRNINRIPGLAQSKVQFPIDSMLLLVGQKPKPPPRSGGLLFSLCFLLALIGGSIAFNGHRQKQRAF